MPKLVPIVLNLTQEGAPLAGASVTLYPDPINDWSAGGTSDAQGNVEIYTRGQFKGAAPGKYKVTVSKIEQEPLNFTGDPESDYAAYEKAVAQQKSYYLVDPQYGDMNKTSLVVEVEAGKAVEPLDLGKAVRTPVH